MFYPIQLVLRDLRLFRVNFIKFCLLRHMVQGDAISVTSILSVKNADARPVASEVYHINEFLPVVFLYQSL